MGINAAIYSSASGASTGIGFAIPVNLAKALVDRWLQGKNPGHLGLLPRNLDDDMASFLGLDSTSGAFVQRVDPGSPAERGGLLAKDIIREFNGHPVTDINHLKILITRAESDEPIPLVVVRNGVRETLQVTLQPEIGLPFVENLATGGELCERERVIPVMRPNVETDVIVRHQGGGDGEKIAFVTARCNRLGNRRSLGKQRLGPGRWPAGDLVPIKLERWSRRCQ